MQVWSVHKFFCQQDDVGRRTFSFPPLTAEEADYFRVLPNGHVVYTLSIVGGEDEKEDWITAVARAGWYPKDRRDTANLEFTRMS